MLPEQLIRPENVLCNARARGKKHCLQILSEMLAQSSHDIANEEIFSRLIERERLGSTSLGRGVAFPHCRVSGAGRSGAIVNVASIEGSDPAVGHAHYATSKAGVLMFTRAAALEYGEYSIRVNAVSPGLIRRERIETGWPDGVKRWKSKAPLQRLGEAADVADAVLFLLSPAARWISGANLVVDGGMSAVSRW